jgi:nitrite reductase/ring-hydroxylating ferredoxin subunit
MSAEFRTVARVDEIAAGTVRAVSVDGTDVALARCGDGFFAVQAACLHLHGPLGDGRLEGCVLTCPWHGWQYDVRTGENEFDGAIALATYEVRVEDGDVRVAV